MARFTFDDGPNQFLQEDNDSPSVFGDEFLFLGGNDRLVLQRNDDLAGLGDGVADMGEGRDVVITSFNMNGLFLLGGGDDFFSTFGDFGAGAIVRASGGGGNDLFVVSSTESTYVGDDGDDIFVSDGARNFFDGGAGIDTFSLELAEEETRIDMGFNNQAFNAEGKAFAKFNLSADQFVNIENIRGSSFRDVIFGDINANRLEGLEGDDDIDGDAGNDTISGGAGANNLFGGNGFDTLIIEGSITFRSRINSASFIVSGLINGAPFQHVATGFEQISDNGILKSMAFFLGEIPTNTTQPTRLAGVAPVELAAGFFNGQTIIGDDADNRLSGGIGFDDIAGLGGDDDLSGGEGDDALSGGEGDDLLKGEAGRDAIDGGAGSDTADYSDKRAAVVISLNGATPAAVSVGGLEEETVRNIENLIGGAAADRFSGDGSDNILRGMAGDDTLQGGAGSDLLSGGAGQDTILGGTGSDTADYSDKRTAVVISLNSPAAVTVSVTGVVEDTLVSIENLIGGRGADRLTGDGAANTLDGRNGRDTLTGGNGRDVFRFSAPGGIRDADVVVDFKSRVDKISLNRDTYPGFGAQTTLQSSQLIAGAGVTAADTRSQRLIYDTRTGILLFDGDGSGPTLAQQVARLGSETHPLLRVTDVLLG